MAKGSVFLPRDLLEKAMIGALSIITLDDGTVLRGVREVAPDAQLVLDQITQTPWSLLVRLPDGWYGLDPGDVDQVVGMTATGEIAWIDQSGGGGGASPDFQPPLASAFSTMINSPTLNDSPLGLGIAKSNGSDMLAAAFAPSRLAIGQ